MNYWNQFDVYDFESEDIPFIDISSNIIYAMPDKSDVEQLNEILETIDKSSTSGSSPGAGTNPETGEHTIRGEIVDHIVPGYKTVVDNYIKGSGKKVYNAPRLYGDPLDNNIDPDEDEE